MAGFPNVYQNFDVKLPILTNSEGEELNLKGKWHKLHFKNNNPITLELACGRGEYTIGLARSFPERNFVGIDIKGARIWKGAKHAIEEGLDNAAFLRTRIEQIAAFFEPGEIDDIWITFPDPFLKKGKANRRLTSPAFLARYQKIMNPGQPIHLKTDSPELFGYTLAVVKGLDLIIEEENHDIYAGPLPLPELDIKTYYEKMHLENGLKIRYVRFKLPENPIPKMPRSFGEED